MKKVFTSFVVLMVLACYGIAASEAPSISPGQGEIFLRMLNNLQLTGALNNEELAFHLCDLAAGFFESDDQKKQALAVLDITREIREKRDAGIKGAGKETSEIHGNEYEVAKSLYRLAAAQMLINFFKKEWGGQEFSFVSYDKVAQKLPDLKLDFPGYVIDWDDPSGSQLLFISARPKDYGKDGTISFLLSNINGIVHLKGGDFKGEEIPVDDSRVGNISLEDLVNKWNAPS